MDYPEGHERPRTRADCVDGPRPCPWVSCKHHLYLDITPFNTIKVNYPDLEPDEIPHSCALDIADEGDHSLEQVGEILGYSKERVRQVEEIAHNKIREALRPWGEELEK